ncbi:hypothetical protein L210DRAFT_3629267 [Boletus edulis BED1]|uniref:Uncharacterized protein n=1 Tax=Boletus edulis BED1 TaxID=1328754 RepID=A0AAD4BYT7_BOLED|nr:hypothetical protein L210DRAFT_3629267 [Boletus edulis BED1]
MFWFLREGVEDDDLEMKRDAAAGSVAECRGLDVAIGAVPMSSATRGSSSCSLSGVPRSLAGIWKASLYALDNASATTITFHRCQRRLGRSTCLCAGWVPCSTTTNANLDRIPTAILHRGTPHRSDTLALVSFATRRGSSLSPCLPPHRPSVCNGKYETKRSNAATIGVGEEVERTTPTTESVEDRRPLAYFLTVCWIWPDHLRPPTDDRAICRRAGPRIIGDQFTAGAVGRWINGIVAPSSSMSAVTPPIRSIPYYPFMTSTPPFRILPSLSSLGTSYHPWR